MLHAVGDANKPDPVLLRQLISLQECHVHVGRLRLFAELAYWGHIFEEVNVNEIPFPI